MANIVRFGNQFTNALWAKQSGVNFTDSWSGLADPNGTFSASQMIKTVQNSGEFQQDVTLTPNTTYTVSLYVWYPTSGGAQGQFKFWSGSSNTFSTAWTTTQTPAGWVRQVWTFTTPSSMSGPNIGWQYSATINTPGATTYIWGFQLESGSTATTYFPAFPLTDNLTGIPLRGSRTGSFTATLGGLTANYGTDRNKLSYGNSPGAPSSLTTFGDTTKVWHYDTEQMTWKDGADWFPPQATFAVWDTVLGWTAVNAATVTTAAAPDTRPALKAVISIASGGADGVRYAFVSGALPTGMQGSWNSSGTVLLSAAMMSGYRVRANVYVPPYSASTPGTVQVRTTDVNGKIRISAAFTLPTAGGWVAVQDYLENTGGQSVDAGYSAASVSTVDILVKTANAGGFAGPVYIEYVDFQADANAAAFLTGRIVSKVTPIVSSQNLLSRQVGLVPGRTYTASCYQRRVTSGDATIQFQYFQPTATLAAFTWNISANVLGWQAAGNGVANLKQWAGNLEADMNLSAANPNGEIFFNLATSPSANLTALVNGDGSYNVAEANLGIFGYYGSFSGTGVQNQFRVFFQDINGKRRYSAAQSPVAGSGGTYYGDYASLTLNLTGASIDSGFDPTHLVRIGVQFTVPSGAAGYVGAVTYTLTTLTAQQQIVNSSYLGGPVGWNRFSWTFTAPSWSNIGASFAIILPGITTAYITGLQLVEGLTPDPYAYYPFTLRVDGLAASSGSAVSDSATVSVKTGNLTCAVPAISRFRPTARSYGLNLGAATNYTPEWIFLDQWKQSSPWVETRTTDDTWDPNGIYGQIIPALSLDSDGWPLALPSGMALYKLMQRGTANYPTGVYTVLYDGNGHIRYDSNAIGTHQTTLLSSSAAGSNTTRHLVQNNGGTNGILMKIDQIDPANPLRNVRVIMPGLESVYAAQVFHPDWLKQVQPFRTFRFMEWQNTNNSTIVNWSQRAVPSNCSYSGDQTGVPLEIIIQLCNLLQADCWICVPPYASDDYVTQMAMLLKNTLNPSLRIWLEYGNEFWNGSFKTNWYCTNSGAATGTGTAMFGSGASSWQNNYTFYAQRTVKVHALFDQVFSGVNRYVQPVNAVRNVQTPRLVKVIGTQHASAGVTTSIQSAARFFWGNTYKPDTVAGGYYFPPSDTWVNALGTQIINTVDDLFADAAAQNVSLYASLTAQVAACNAWGCRYTAYESGGNWIPPFWLANPVGPNTVALALTANKDPRMITMYQDAIAQWQALGGQDLMFFTSCSVDSQYGTFGVLNYTGQPISNAPKYAAVLNMLNTKLDHGFPTMAGGPRSAPLRRMRRAGFGARF